MMPPAYATGICSTHVRGADARTYGRTYADNYSTCEAILLLSNAHEQNPHLVADCLPPTRRGGVVNRPTFIANVHREDPWWVIDIPQVGVTQAKRTEDIEHMARDLVESLTGSSDVNVWVRFA